MWDVSQGPYCLVYVLMLSAVPIVTQIVSYLQMIFRVFHNINDIEECKHLQFDIDVV